MRKPFYALEGRPVSDTTFEWPCGCIVHSFEGVAVAKACCNGHDQPLDDFITPTLLDLNPDIEIERVYVERPGDPDA